LYGKRNDILFFYFLFHDGVVVDLSWSYHGIVWDFSVILRKFETFFKRKKAILILPKK